MGGSNAHFDAAQVADAAAEGVDVWPMRSTGCAAERGVIRSEGVVPGVRYVMRRNGDRVWTLKAATCRSWQPIRWDTRAIPLVTNVYTPVVFGMRLDSPCFVGWVGLGLF